MNALAFGLAALIALALPLAAGAQDDANMFDAGRMQCRAPVDGADRVQIAGGQDATADDYPFIVQVRGRAGDCGGSLFAPGFVLTAAHCVMPPPGGRGCRPDGPGKCRLAEPATITVHRPGARGEPDGESRAVTKLVAHPKFRYPVRGDFGGALDADIAILRLDRPFDLPMQDYVQIADAGFDHTYASGGACARVAGWGQTDVLSTDRRVLVTGKRTKVLQQLNLALLDRERCAERYEGQITDNMLCAGDGVEGFNTCRGDSGGPLVLDVGVPVQVGVVSWAYGCAQSEHYTVFARIGADEVRDWIDKIMLGR